MNAIKFYTTKDEHGYMSNFARYKIDCFGRVWQTSEHAYQAKKFVGMNIEDYDAVFNADRPMVAAALGRDPNRPIRPDWEAVKDDVMRFVVLSKFMQNPKIREKLLSTGDAPLFEYDTVRGDTYWAINRHGHGKNMLGVILMEVREVLRENEQFWIEHENLVLNCAKCQNSDVQCPEHERCVSPSSLYILSCKF